MGEADAVERVPVFVVELCPDLWDDVLHLWKNPWQETLGVTGPVF